MVTMTYIAIKYGNSWMLNDIIRKFFIPILQHCEVQHAKYIP